MRGRGSRTETMAGSGAEGGQAHGGAAGPVPAVGRAGSAFVCACVHAHVFVCAHACMRASLRLGVEAVHLHVRACICACVPVRFCMC